MWQITKMWESICGGFKFIFSWFQIYSFCLLFANGAGPWYFSLASQEVVQPGLYRALEGHWRRKALFPGSSCQGFFSPLLGPVWFLLATLLQGTAFSSFHVLSLLTWVAVSWSLRQHRLWPARLLLSRPPPSHKHMCGEGWDGMG